MIIPEMLEQSMCISAASGKRLRSTRANRNMYIQSGEWVIISKVKRQFRFRDKILKNMRFRLIMCIMLAGLVPCLAALFGIVKFYESRAVELRTAEIQNQCTILSNQLNNFGYLTDTSSEVYQCVPHPAYRYLQRTCGYR